MLGEAKSISMVTYISSGRERFAQGNKRQKIYLSDRKKRKKLLPEQEGLSKMD